MVRYDGRTSQDAYTHNFGGLNSVASLVNGKTNEASSISNWDVNLSGAIARRYGYATKYTFGSDTNHLDTFFKLDGTQVYVTVSGGHLYESTSPSGPWADRGGTLTGGDFTYIGTYLNGQYVLCNGIDKPIVFIPGQAVQTLEDASLLTAPTNLSISSVNGSGAAYQYVVTALTPRGETVSSAIVGTIDGPTSLSATAYNTVFWTPPAGAFSQKIYRFNTATNTFDLIALLAGGVTSYVDNGATADIYSHPPASNTAYNTPEDWNTNGQPEGVFVVARGQNQRMLAWRKSYYWLCALSNIYDWYTENNSFSGYILGGQDNNIKAVTTLYDYTVFFSKTNSFVFTGDDYATFGLSKILNTGCQSHYSITHVGDEAILWSQQGPTTVLRILSGADVATTSVGQKITNTIYNDTNLDYWYKIRAWHDQRNHMTYFAIAGDGETKNTLVMGYNYQTKGWVIYDGLQVENVVYDPVSQVNYAILDGNSVVQLHTANQDGATAITNHYQTHFLEGGSEYKKRLLWLDVDVDAYHPYSVTVTVQMDYNSSNIETHVLAFDGATATTDGQPILDQGGLVNMHRVPMSGVGDAFRIRFEDTFNGYPARILGWRPDYRLKGVR